MYELTLVKQNGNAYIDSREVAAAIGKSHNHLLRDIRGYCEIMRKGGVSKVGQSEFFVKSSYINAQNKEMPCYLLTKMACELVGNKLVGERGVLFTTAYGYIKSPDDKNVWLVDEEASLIVKRIFQMAIDGMGSYQIARRLATERIEKPSAYFARTKGWIFDGKDNAPYAWNGGTVKNILTKPEYCGKTVNFRTIKESYKSKKFRYRDKSEWKVFDDTHPAIIDEQSFETVQKLLETVRRPSDCGEANPLTGILFCHECGKKMYNSRQKATHYTEKRFGKVYQHKVTDFYTCSTNSLSKGVFEDKCSQHYIRTEVVRQIVLCAIRTQMLNEFISRVEIYEADKSSGERVQNVDVYFRFIGKFAPPQEEHIPTEEELAEQEKRRQRLIKQREANRRWYAKRKAEHAAAM